MAIRSCRASSRAFFSLKTFDFAGIIESLGTGIQRMIDACRASELPDPTWEQRGHSLIATIWKDTWTPMRLRETGVSERQMLAIPMLKRNRQITVAEYMSLAGVRRNTATADLAKLEKSGVVVRQGVGRGVVYAFCEMHNKCTKCTTDILRNKSQMRKTSCKTGGSAANVASHRHANAVVKTTLQTTTKTTTQTTTQIPISSATRHVLDLLKAEPLLSGDNAAQRLGLTRDGFYYHVKILRKAVGLRHTGGTKRGRWEVEKS